MPQFTEKQQRKLKKLADVFDKGNIAVLEHLFEIEEKIDESVSELESKIPDLTEVAKSLRGKDGETPVKGVDYFDGADGKDYVLTEKDKKEIAKSIPVPIVEKVIEKTETVIKEVPIVTNEIVKEVKTVEVAVLDDATVAYLEDKITQVDTKVQDFVKARPTKHSDGIGLVVRQLRAGTGVTIDDTSQEYPIISASVTGAVGTLQQVTDEGTTTTNDIEITDTTKGVIIKSANGTRWRIGITNNGELTAVSL